MIRAAIDEGLDALVITDHDHVSDESWLRYLNAKYAPFRVFGGTEITTRGEHILVLGVEERAVEERWWSYPELHSFVREREGFLAVAHPFRFNPARVEADLDAYPPDALEAYSCNTPVSAAHRIRDLAARLDVPVLSDSDAHHVSQLGDHYNVLDEEPGDVRGLMSMLRAEAFDIVAPE